MLNVTPVLTALTADGILEVSATPDAVRFAAATPSGDAPSLKMPRSVFDAAAAALAGERTVDALEPEVVYTRLRVHAPKGEIESASLYHMDGIYKLIVNALDRWPEWGFGSGRDEDGDFTDVSLGDAYVRWHVPHDLGLLRFYAAEKDQLCVLYVPAARLCAMEGVTHVSARPAEARTAA